MTSEFVSLSRFYTSLYVASLQNSKYCLLSSNRREFLIRNEFGKKTVELFFDLALKISALRLNVVQTMPQYPDALLERHPIEQL